MDMASNGVNVALLEAYGGQLANGTSLIEDAYSRVHNEVTVHPQVKVDGIKPDGSFSQHIDILYTGKCFNPLDVTAPILISFSSPR